MNNPALLAGLFLWRHPLTDEEKQHLQKGADGIRHMFYNGIYNTPDEAARNAVQLADNEHEPLYFTVFPQAEDKLVEFGVAVFQKFFEGKLFFGLTNSTKKFQNTMSLYGNTGLHVDAHSRGALTAGNGLRDFEQHGIHGIAENTSINLFGPAYNAQKMANTLYILSNGKQTYVNLENHADDFVGVVFGGNPATFDQRPLGSNAAKEAGKVVFGYPSPHGCYGDADKACTKSYGSPHRKKVHSTRTGSKK
ncbi:hypothetical protein [Bartonella harrusi]|uniref:Filamentous hemagglutinin n=1 Tax=Bartonella harrusi TaxID=2961895 RepID=A0ABY5EXV6_9HYPH|nr:hypothetical protein [Bartonella harrusi]UTO29000.1 hypothetical protein NMK50_03230 [Bartonella harrusi]